MKTTLTKYVTPTLTFMGGALIAGAMSVSAQNVNAITNTNTQATLPCKGGMHHNLTDAEKQAHRTEMNTAVAKILGISVADLQAKQAAGTSMKDIIAGRGMTEAAFQEKMQAIHLAEMKTKLQADVAAGKITQTQADQMIANMQSHQGKGFGGKGMMGGMR